MVTVVILCHSYVTSCTSYFWAWFWLYKSCKMLQVQDVSISYWLFYEDIRHVRDLSFVGANSSQLGERTEPLFCACIYFNKVKKIGRHWKHLSACKFVKIEVDVFFFFTSKVTWSLDASLLQHINRTHILLRIIWNNCFFCCSSAAMFINCSKSLRWKDM